MPKVGILSAVEVINPKIPSTLDAAALCKMADRGQITGGILDGPLAFDNAISAQAAKTKGIISQVSGDVDILLAPDLEAANMLFKQLTYLAGARGAGMVLEYQDPHRPHKPCRLDTDAARFGGRHGASRPRPAKRQVRD